MYSNCSKPPFLHLHSDETEKSSCKVKYWTHISYFLYHPSPKVIPQSLRHLPGTPPASWSSKSLLVFSILSSNMQSTCPIFKEMAIFPKVSAIWFNPLTLRKPCSKTVVLKVWSGPAASKINQELRYTQILGSYLRPTQLETLGVGLSKLNKQSRWFWWMLSLTTAVGPSLVAQLVRASFQYAKVVDSIPSQGTYKIQLMNA